MLEKKQWVEEFTTEIQKTGLIVGFRIQNKFTWSWANIGFPHPPDVVADVVLEFIVSVNRLIEKKFIDRSQAHGYIHNMLSAIFLFQFDVFFILPDPESNTLTDVSPDQSQTSETTTLNS